MKIWYQSGSVWNPKGEYALQLEKHMNAIKRQEVTITYHGLEKSFGKAPYNCELIFRTTIPGGIFNNFVRAEEEGYDAIILGDPMDPGLYPSRQLVDIPVLGFSETCMFVACMLGHKFSVITWATRHLVLLEMLAKQYGLESRKVPFIDMGINNAKDLSKGFSDATDLVHRFQISVQKAIDLGAEVIIPGGAILDLILSKNQIREVHGALVMDCVAVLLKMAEGMAELRKIGISYSRKSLFATENKKQIREFLDFYIK